MFDDAASKGHSPKENLELPVELKDGTLQFHSPEEMENFASLIVKQAAIKAKHGLSDDEVGILKQPLGREPLFSQSVTTLPDGIIRYLNIYTDPETREIWIEGERKNVQRFQRDSFVYFLWLYLLESKGNLNEKTEIGKYMQTQTGRTQEHYFKFDKHLENLKQKLKSVTHETSEFVSSWFKETDTHLALETLD